MPTERRRIQITVDEDVFRALALDPKEHGAVQVSAALARYARHVSVASRELESILTRAEWNAIADVMNGCADLWDYSETALPHLLLIRAQIEDGHRLDGLGDKWFGEGDGDKGVRKLLGKLSKLGEIHGDAIAAAVRYFWSPSGREVDHAEDPWWSLSFRTKPPGEV